MTNRSLVFPQRMVRAGGALVWRLQPGFEGQAPTPDNIEVLLVHRPSYGDWSWPKGKAELNEPLPVAAVREVEEEGQVPVVLRRPLTCQRYRLSSGAIKEVHYWVGTVLQGGPALAARRPVSPAQAKEVDHMRWFPTGKARQLLTRRGDRRLLDELVGYAREGTLQTAAVVYIRHAKAVSRGQWNGGEAARPVSRLGGVQALDLIPLLSAFGVELLWSSPWLQCKQTGQPYATVSQAQLDEFAALTETAVEADPAGAIAVSRQALLAGTEAALERSDQGREVSGSYGGGNAGAISGEAGYAIPEGGASNAYAPSEGGAGNTGGGGLALCLHRSTIETLLEPVREYARTANVLEPLTTPEPTLKSAEMFVVHVSVEGNSPEVAVPTALEASDSPGPVDGKAAGFAAVGEGDSKRLGDHPNAASQVKSRRPLVVAIERHSPYSKLALGL